MEKEPEERIQQKMTRMLENKMRQVEMTAICRKKEQQWVLYYGILRVIEKVAQSEL